MVRLSGVAYGGAKYSSARVMFCAAWSGNGKVEPGRVWLGKV